MPKQKTDGYKQLHKKYQRTIKREYIFFLTRFVNSLDFRNQDHRFLYDQAMIRIFGKNSMGYSNHLREDNLEFTRVRINSCQGICFSNLKDVLYCPTEKSKIGRANLQGESVLYCSNYPKTSIFEVKPKLGDWITTTVFKYNKPYLTSLVLGADVSKLKDFNSLPPYIQGLHDYLRKVFTEQIQSKFSHKYYKTASICKSIIGNTNSIMYPSVASNLEGWNYAFTIDETNSNLKFCNSRVQEIIEYKSQFEFKVKCLYISESLNDNKDIIWNKNFPECNGHNLVSTIY